MEEHKLQDIIDAYLKGTITDTNRQWLENRMEHDAEIIRQVNRSKEAYRFLQYADYQDIRQKITAYDRENGWKQKRKFFGKTGTILLALLIPFLLFIGYALHVFHPVTLAKKYYASNWTSEGLNKSDMEFDTAHYLFRMGDYQGALEWNESLLNRKTLGRPENAMWNVLLCRLAMEGPGKNWQREMDLFIEMPANPFKESAVMLRKQTRSVFCRIASINFSPAMTTLRPRLI